MLKIPFLFITVFGDGSVVPGEAKWWMLGQWLLEVRSTNGPEVSAALTQSSHNVTAAS